MILFHEFSCKGCVPPKRHAGCHSTCEEYIRCRNEYEEIKKDVERKKRAEGLYQGYKKHVVHRAIKRRGDK